MFSIFVYYPFQTFLIEVSYENNGILSKLHRYYLKLSGKKAFSFCCCFYFRFILGSAFSNYKNASEMKRRHIRAMNMKTIRQKKHEDKKLEELPQSLQIKK